MLIDVNGNVGIGDTTPSYLLDVAGIGRFTGLVDASHFIECSELPLFVAEQPMPATRTLCREIALA